MTYTVLVHSTDETYDGEGHDRWLWASIEYFALFVYIKNLPFMSDSNKSLQRDMMVLELSKYNGKIYRKQEGWQRNTYFEFESDADYIHFKLRWG